MPTLILGVYIAYTIIVAMVCTLCSCMPIHTATVMGYRGKPSKWALPFIVIMSILEVPAVLIHIAISIIASAYMCGMDRGLCFKDCLDQLVDNE